MDWEKEQKELTNVNDENISFGCMMENQKNLMEAMNILSRCIVLTCSEELKDEYKELIMKIEKIYLKESKYVMSLKGLL